MLNNADIETLETYLFSEENSDSALDYFGFHGLITASVVAPRQPDTKDLWNIALASEPGKEIECPLTVSTLVTKLQQHIKKALEHEETIELPYSEEDDDDTITNWCTGFIEGHLCNEEQWFKKDEEAVAELLLPIITLSDFHDEMEMKDLHDDSKLLIQLVEQIPEVVTDLYLLYHSNE